MWAITFRLNSEQEKEIKIAAKMQKMNVSEYIKKKIFYTTNINTEVQIEKQKDSLNEIIELLNNLILQIKISSSLQSEILKSVNPNEAKNIIISIKEFYKKRSANKLWNPNKKYF